MTAPAILPASIATSTRFIELGPLMILAKSETPVWAMRGLALNDPRLGFDAQAVFRCVLKWVPLGRRSFGCHIERGDRPHLHDRYRRSGPPGRLNDPFDIHRLAELALDL